MNTTLDWTVCFAYCTSRCQPLFAFLYLLRRNCMLARRGVTITNIKHKVDARATKAFKINNLSMSVVAEVFNLFNHENFGSYNAVVTSPLFGQPQQNIGNAYRPRTGQLAVRVQF